MCVSSAVREILGWVLFVFLLEEVHISSLGENMCHVTYRHVVLECVGHKIFERNLDIDEFSTYRGKVFDI